MKAKYVVVFVCTLLMCTAGSAVGSINIDDAVSSQPKQLLSGRSWSDDFDSYTLGQFLDGEPDDGGWEGWADDPSFGAFVVDDQAYSTPHSVEIAGTSDLVHEYSGYTSGEWIYTTMQFIPTDFSGISYFILLCEYDGGGTNTIWAVQLGFDSATGLVTSEFNGETMTMVQGQWVELRCLIDLDADWLEIYYDEMLLAEHAWTDTVQGSGGGTLNIAAVDLFANGATPVYYDDMSLGEPLPLSCSANGPYAGVVGEPVQFEGSASGGSPPYEYLWTFGDGETSTEEDPVHVYDDAGDYSVGLTVTDAAMDVVSDATTASIVGLPDLEIRKVEGGLLKVSANIKNSGSLAATDAAWSIVLDGGLILLGKETTGTVTIAPDATETIESGLIFGFGSTTITVMVEVPDSSDTFESSGFVLLFFVNVTPGG